MSDAALLARDKKRDLGAELLASVMEMKAMRAFERTRRKYRNTFRSLAE